MHTAAAKQGWQFSWVNPHLASKPADGLRAGHWKVTAIINWIQGSLC